MSLILDALNRSRQDADPVPGLATQHPTEPMAVRGRQALPWIALLAALLLIIWLVWERNEPGASVPAEGINAPVAELSRNIGSAVTSVTNELKARAEVSTEADSAAAVANSERILAPAIPKEVVPESVPLPEPRAAIATAQSVEPAPASAAVQSTEPAPAPTRTPVAGTATETPSAVGENAAVEELYRERDKPLPEKRTPPRDTQPARAVEEQPIDIESALRLAQAELENASLTAHPAPFLESLSQQTKDDIPTIYYQQHDYASQESRSSVMLNGKTLKAGGSPLSGMKVDEILPDSVVLSYRGTQFRLRALNSWINL